MRYFRGLKVRQQSPLFALETYRNTRASYLNQENYAPVSQIRRSVSSIPTNIAEGCGRNADGDFARFLDYGMGSASELEYQLLSSRDLGYPGTTLYEKLPSDLVEIRRMLNSLIQKVRVDAEKS